MLAAEGGAAEAQCMVGVMYASGDMGLEQDDESAIVWLRRAAEQGQAQAQFNLAAMYDEGRGVPKVRGWIVFGVG